MNLKRTALILLGTIASLGAVAVGNNIVNARENHLAQPPMVRPRPNRPARPVENWYNCLTREVWMPDKQAWCNSLLQLQDSSFEFADPASGTFQLQDGNFSGEEGLRVMLVNRPGRIQFTDINDDNKKDALSLLAVTTGGSGVFQFLGVSLGNDNGFDTGTTVLLGDRVQVQAITYGNGQIAVRMLTHDNDDPMVSPTKQVTNRYALQGGELVFVGEGEVVVGREAFAPVDLNTLPAASKQPGTDLQAIALTAFPEPPPQTEGNYRQEVTVTQQGETAMVIITRTGLLDDSIEGVRFRLDFEKVTPQANQTAASTQWQLVWTGRQQTCRAGRGSQQWDKANCS